MLHALLHETLHIFTCILPHSVHYDYMIGYIRFTSIITWRFTWYYIVLHVCYMSYYMAGYTENYMTFHSLLHGFLHVTLHDFTWHYMITEFVTWNLHIWLHDCYIVHYMNNYRIWHDIFMELHVIPWNLCLFPQAGRACAAKTCASRLVAACMQGQPGVAEDRRTHWQSTQRWEFLIA